MSDMMRGDHSYQLAREAKRGTVRISSPLMLLAERIEARFGPRPLWINADTIPRPNSRHEVRPRLDVVFERITQFTMFESSPYAFDPAKQAAVAADFADVVAEAAQAHLFHVARGQRLGADLFVCFSAFEPAALEDAHLSVPIPAIDLIAQRIFGDAYWQASRLFGAPVIFLHTEAQVARYRDQPVLVEVDDAYRDLVAAQDEFGYFDRRKTFVPLDSKENFDANFSSNWYYYWK